MRSGQVESRQGDMRSGQRPLRGGSAIMPERRRIQSAQGGGSATRDPLVQASRMLKKVCTHLYSDECDGSSIKNQVDFQPDRGGPGESLSFIVVKDLLRTESGLCGLIPGRHEFT